MTSEDYIEKFLRGDQNDKQNDEQNNNKRLDKVTNGEIKHKKHKFHIKSINKSERLTGTIYFFKSNLTAKQDESLVHSIKEGACISLRSHGMYTPISYAVNIGDTKGVVVEVYTVENQFKNDRVPNAIQKAMHEIGIRQPQLQQMLRDIQKSTICIQVRNE